MSNFLVGKVNFVLDVFLLINIFVINLILRLVFVIESCLFFIINSMFDKIGKVCLCLIVLDIWIKGFKNCFFDIVICIIKLVLRW